jgi:hypothetical protein
MAYSAEVLRLRMDHTSKKYYLRVKCYLPSVMNFWR